MKVLFTTILVFMSAFVFAQQIQNADFENWTTHTPYENPQDFSSSNMYSFFMFNQANVTKVTDASEGTYAARIETIIQNGDSLMGIITNGDNAMNDIIGGVPYTSTPDSLKFDVKFDVNTNDTAAVLVMFKSQGNIIAFGMKQFSGQQTSYSSEKVAILWFMPGLQPDTMLFAVGSSIAEGHEQNGSWIQVDDVRLDNTPIQNGGFENWDQIQYEDADHWTTFNPYSVYFLPSVVEKSTDAYNGNFAIKLTTRIVNGGDDTATHFTNGRLTESDFIGGMRVYHNPMKVTGYYKYTPVGNDTAIAAVRAYGYDNSGNYQNLDNDLIKLAPTSTYTYFELNLSYNSWPLIDTLGVAFAASNVHNGQQWVNEGSALWIDSLNIVYYPTSIEEEIPELSVDVYPIPAQNEVNVVFSSPVNEEAIITVYQLDGKKVKQETLTGTTLYVGDLVNGMYFYSIQLDEESIKGKFSILRQ